MIHSSSKQRVVSSLALLLISAAVFYIFTCLELVSAANRINAFGPMSSSENLGVALGASVLIAFSGGLLVYAIAPRLSAARHAKRPVLFFLGLSNLVMSALAVAAAWFIYADSVFCSGCETGSCVGLVLFRSLKLWAAGVIATGSVLLVFKSLRK